MTKPWKKQGSDFQNYNNKTMIKKLLVLLMALTGLASCTKQPKLDGIDLEKWREDRGGCSGQRASMKDQIKALKEELKGVSANDMDDYLGKPDIQQLADRNQKYYIYFLEKGVHCEDKTKKSDAESLGIRFSAMGMATEITFQKGTP